MATTGTKTAKPTPGAKRAASAKRGGKTPATAAKPATVKAYLAGLPDERRTAITKVRKTIVDNLPKGYQETVGLGMIMYSVPLAMLPETYNGQPLCYVAVASQKNHMSLYLMSVYGDEKNEQWFRDQFAQRGKKLDMGKSCVRFKTVDDLPLDVIGAVVGKYSVNEWVRLYRQLRGPASRASRAADGTRAAAATARRSPGR